MASEKYAEQTFQTAKAEVIAMIKSGKSDQEIYTGLLAISMKYQYNMKACAYAIDFSNAFL